MGQIRIQPSFNKAFSQKLNVPIAAVQPHHNKHELFLSGRLDLPTRHTSFERTRRQDRRIRPAFTRRQIAPEHHAALIIG